MSHIISILRTTAVNANSWAHGNKLLLVDTDVSSEEAVHSLDQWESLRFQC